MLTALSNGEFQLYIQPKWEIAADMCGGGEALVRWESPQMGLISPDKFIPVFEENNFIVELDFYMLSKVLKMLQNEMKSPKEPYPISVNVSKVTMMFPNYIERLADTIKRFKVPGKYVELEITETAMCEGDYSTVRSLMCEMKKMGFNIAMDDFGSGNSSFNTLRELPVDVLKIDKAFLDAAEESEKSKTIIKSVVDMARNINMKTVCEGVETQSQLAFLKSIDCNLGQGYLFSRPIPYREYEAKFRGLQWAETSEQQPLLVNP
jgi:EAL domain-containing protein (putative c-di-GMP-specific phosphodiesterase class I)